MKPEALMVAVLLGGCGAGAPPASSTHRSERPARAVPSDDRSWQKLVDDWQDGDPLPDFELVDQSGKRFRLRAFGGGYLFMSFAFSSCQVVKACPTTMKKTLGVQELWTERRAQPEARGTSLHLLTCTLDPENDTPPVLAEYGKVNGADFALWTLATGPTELMERGLPSLLGVMAMRDGRGTLNHGVKAALFVPGLRPIKEWDDNGFEPVDVVRALLDHAARERGGTVKE